MEKFTFVGFLLRLVAALVLVFASFNPSGHSYAHWVAHDFPSIAPLQAVVGIVLLIGWGVFLTATARSVGMIGVLLMAALFAAVVWLVVSWGWLDPSNTTSMAWITLVLLAVVLAVGMSWSHLRRRMTGQADVDEVDTRH